MVVNYGFLAGQPCMIMPTHAIIHEITLKGFWLVKRLFQRPRAEIENTYADIAGLFMDGTFPIRFTPTPTRARMGANRI